MRIGFGLALAFAGFAHYQDPSYPFMVGSDLGVLQPIGTIWGYILPGLMIIGGLLLAFGIYAHIAAYVAAIALASIPAGLMLKSAISPELPIDEMISSASTALIWLIVLLAATKSSYGSCCSTSDCGCQDDVKPAVKSMPVAPSATVKSVPMKKAPAKKIGGKRS